MFAARAFTPFIWIDGRKVGIAIDVLVNVRDAELRRERHGLAIDFGAAGNDDGVCVAPQGVAARRRQRGIEARRHHDARRGKVTVAADHDGGATVERLADRQIGLAPHHHRLAHGQRAEMLHVRFEPPRQRIAAADDAVLGDGCDEYNLLHDRQRNEPYAAKFALCNSGAT